MHVDWEFFRKKWHFLLKFQDFVLNFLLSHIDSTTARKYIFDLYQPIEQKTRIKKFRFYYIFIFRLSINKNGYHVAVGYFGLKPKCSRCIPKNFFLTIAKHIS